MRWESQAGTAVHEEAELQAGWWGTKNESRVESHFLPWLGLKSI